MGAHDHVPRILQDCGVEIRFHKVAMKPGKPALFGTTKAFLDYFNLSSLDDLPSLAEIKDMETIEPELDLEATEDS